MEVAEGKEIRRGITEILQNSWVIGDCSVGTYVKHLVWGGGKCVPTLSGALSIATPHLSALLTAVVLLRNSRVLNLSRCCSEQFCGIGPFRAPLCVLRPRHYACSHDLIALAVRLGRFRVRSLTQTGGLVFIRWLHGITVDRNRLPRSALCKRRWRCRPIALLAFT